MPSLVQSREQIPVMLRHFMMNVAQRYACPLPPIAPRLVKACENYSWPGNIRELETFVKRYLVLGDEQAAIADFERNIVPELTPPSAARVEPQGSDLKQMVKSVKNGAAMERSPMRWRKAAGIANVQPAFSTSATRHSCIRSGNTISGLDRTDR